MNIKLSSLTLSTGTIGFFASWLFVLKIYKSIKVD